MKLREGWGTLDGQGIEMKNTGGPSATLDGGRMEMILLGGPPA
jgi:hypothetical protein